LSNGSLVNEQMLVDAGAFGAYCGQLMFAFFRQLASFDLNKAELALLCALVFFSADRPLLVDRYSVRDIYAKYMELFEAVYWSSEENVGCPGKSNVPKIILSFLKLKALDSLSKRNFYINFSIFCLTHF
jgi:hypothetical protein